MLEHKVYDLQSAEEGEACEESHGAANSPKLVGEGDAYVLDVLVIGRCVEVDLDNSEGLVRFWYSLELLPPVSTAIIDNFKVAYL